MVVIDKVVNALYGKVFREIFHKRSSAMFKAATFKAVERQMNGARSVFKLGVAHCAKLS